MAIKYYAETEYTAICEECGETESIYSGDGQYRDDYTPSKYFRRQGWSDKSGVTLCPECVKGAKP